jgi:NitT/TauT family transport system permease protein
MTVTEILGVLSPLKVVNKRTFLMLMLGTVAVLASAWVFSPSPLLPNPSEVWSCFKDQWEAGLGTQLIISYTLNLQAILWSIVISLGLSYLSVVPIFKPLVMMSTYLRFLSMAGLSVAFAVAIANPHTVKVAMLTFSISVWFITSMLDVIKDIPQEQYDLARTLRMGKWRVVWEVVVLGQADRVFDVLRQVAAMGWMMLTMVESIVFAEGGVGTVLQTMQKHARFGDIMAIQICILLLGAGQDYAIGVTKNLLCPYAALNGGKR